MWYARTPRLTVAMAARALSRSVAETPWASAIWPSRSTHLPRPAHEVAGRHVAVEVVPAGQHLRQRLAAGPPVDRPDEAQIRFPGERSARGRPRRPRSRPRASGSRRPRRRPRPRGTEARSSASRRASKTHHRDRGGQLGRGRARPRRRRRRHSATSRSASVQIRASIRPASVTSSVARRGSPARSAARRSGRRYGPANRSAPPPCRRSASVSRSSRCRRSAQRACSSRSGQAWQGCWRRSARSWASSVVLAAALGPAAPAPAVPVEAGGAHLGGQVAARRRRAVVEVLRHPDARQHLDRAGEVGRADPAGPAVLGQHQRARLAERRRSPGSSTTARPARRPDGTRITSPTRSRSSESTAAALRWLGALPGQRPLPVGDGHPQREVLVEVAVVALHLGVVRLDRLGVALHLPGQPDHRPVGLELRERGLQQVAGRVRADRADQVDRHVVRRPEARPQRIGPGGGQPGDVPRVDLRGTRPPPRAPRRRCRGARPGR